MKPHYPTGNSASNDVANGVGPTGSPYGGTPDHDDRQWNPPVADEDVPPDAEDKLREHDERAPAKQAGQTHP